MPEIEELKKRLARDALEIRRKHLEMHFKARAGHIGSGLSCIDILAYIYGHWLKGSDKFILSKGHSASALYATLHFYGKMSDEQFSTYYNDNTSLGAHPPSMEVKGIEIATGSLGHGLSIANGLAFASHWLEKSSARVCVLLSDGECNEGSVWEAALFASHHQLKNLTVIIDANGLQGFGRSQDVMNLEPLSEKWRSFGFDVLEVEGHNPIAIHQAMSEIHQKPLCIVARTVKGKGISFMENKLEWHYEPLNQEQFAIAMMELKVNEERLR